MASQESVGSSCDNNVVLTFRRPRILLAASESIDAHAMNFQVLSDSVSQWADITMVVTKTILPSIPEIFPVFVDDTQWLISVKLEVNMLSNVLRDWADIMVIAPLSADTLGKIATGLSDNLLTSIVGAWDFRNKPLIVAPSMNHSKWCNPSTLEHVEMIKRRGVHLIPPTIPDASVYRGADVMTELSTIGGVLLDCLVSTGWKILRSAL